MTDDQLKQLFQRLAEQVMEQPIDGIDPSGEIASLGIDSLGLMEIIEGIEDELALTLPEAELVGVATVGELFELVQRCKSAA